jgi:hypothetical protein
MNAIKKAAAAATTSLVAVLLPLTGLRKNHRLDRRVPALTKGKTS